jgi:predicted nucleic acid-binding protein
VSSFLDTSVVVRYLTGEPPIMAEEAARIIDGGDPLIFTDVALAETAFVLRSVYGLSRETIIDTLIDFVQKRNIEVFGLDKSVVVRGLSLCRPSGRVSVSDTLIWAAARSAGATVIYSFDRRFPSEGLELRKEAM